MRRYATPERAAGDGVVQGFQGRSDLAVEETTTRELRYESRVPHEHSRPLQPMTPPHVLIVDDEADMRWVLERLFRDTGFTVTTAGDGAAALACLDETAPDVILTDVRMPGIDGIAVLHGSRQRDADRPVILLSAVEDLETAVGAMKQGAYDYIAKPFDRTRLLGAVRRAAEKHQLCREVRDLRHKAQDGIVDLGRSSAARELDRTIDLVAGYAGMAVLLGGESGVGKEIAAREIHRRSPRRGGPFVAVDCGAVPEALIESQLFGHAAGAFTGAASAHDGLFTQADGGTLFLDEIGNLPLALQPRLLRALQERVVLPLGATSLQPFDARIVCATNVPLEESIAQGAFRLDLFHRIAEFQIRMPPLRERHEDIRHFAARFLAEACIEQSKQLSGLSDAAQSAILQHTWPGNLRELRNVIRRAVLVANGPLVEQRDLGLDVAVVATPPNNDERPLAERLRAAADDLEARILREALAAAAGNKAAAARQLRIDYTTLHRKLKRHGLS